MSVEDRKTDLYCTRPSTLLNQEVRVNPIARGSLSTPGGVLGFRVESCCLLLCPGCQEDSCFIAIGDDRMGCLIMGSSAEAGAGCGTEH